jgi:diguanylate cyclase (GGDEF)-like protein/PAS domain S-box-containing protein
MMNLMDVISHGHFRERKMHGVFMSPTSGNDNDEEDSDLPHEFDGLPDAIILADGLARVTYLNPVAAQMLGLSRKNAQGHALNKVLVLQDRESGQPVSVCESPSVAGQFNGAFHLLASSDGHWVPVHYSVARTRTVVGGAGGYIVSLRNASSVQAHIDKLAAQNMHDEHTQLLRRAELVKRLWRLLQEAESGEQHAFLYLDLDNFKAVNDQAGHAAGDLAIRQIASRLKAVVRERDTLARLGGDEFGLLLERCPSDLARERAEQLHRAVESYVLRWDGAAFRMGVSIGLTYFKTHNHSLNSILSAADAACYQAKRDAGNGIHIREVTLG